MSTTTDDPPAKKDAPAQPGRRAWWAYVGPFGLFLLLQALPGAVKGLPLGTSQQTPPWWLATPEFWVYPLQTILCAGMLIYFRREYPLENRRFGAVIVGVLIGLAALIIWISPQVLFHAAQRTTSGFDPTRLPPDSGVYHWTLALRFVRLVVVVPFLEEVFWRGFLLRYLVKEDFVAVPFGTFTWLSFGAVAVGFMLEHATADWPAALITGALYNWLAVRTRSLLACIIAHAVTNLLLGIYIMQTRQWGFW